jgi:2-amino-4-hydroxy-6-hydroxymethyldihydropteridine diphosphokinase
MNKAYLLIGGNMGNREGFLAAAREELERKGCRLLQQSALYETAAWGLEDQNPFLNQALEIETSSGPFQLLKKLLQIEKKIGRTRDLKYGPRMIDIDILFFNDAIVQEDFLTIPHPHLQNRRFALVPMQEIAPTFCHPVLKKTITRLLAECPDPLSVQKFH